MTIELIHGDCMDYMKECPDKSFDLAIVDPPYGIREDGHRENNRSKLAVSKNYHKALWDQGRPKVEYFRELERVSKNQIIWGGNHLADLICKSSPCWLVWDKDNSGHFADCELAYTSFETAVRKFRYRWNGMLQGDYGLHSKEERIHPTQKPINLYKYLLSNYSDKDERILDTHLGSGSSAIAAHYYGVDFVGIEIDEDYYKAAVERFNNETAQETLFSEL